MLKKKLPRFFHVSPIEHAVGTVLQPGNFGKHHARYVMGGAIAPNTHKDCYEMTWEAVLETARLLVNAKLPSRQNCVFASTTVEAAKIFRDKFRSNAHIFEIEVAQGTPTFYGDLDSISHGKQGDTFQKIWTETAVRYWKERPPGATEVLIGGPVTIVSRVA